ncbi:MAG: stringent starvation protein [Proteobacteria bacterium]|nr:stringent starvation protein [Pseudomonadota bacterium]
MSPLKPYLIRAVYEWIVDNECTPYLLVDAEANGVIAPRQYVEDGRIVLNLRPQAVQGLSMGDQQIAFSARFGGQPMQVSVPTTAVLAIYARENGRGMVFDSNEGDETPPPTETTPPDEGKQKKGRPTLRVVK